MTPCFRLINIITYLFKKSYRFSEKNLPDFYVIFHKNYEKTENSGKTLAKCGNICDNIRYVPIVFPLYAE